jgi:hypothetical protein
MGEISINKKHNIFKQYRKMNLVNPYRFSSNVNLRIGNVSSVINTEAILAGVLGIGDVSRITLFKIIGNDIECAVTGGTYELRPNAFQGSNLTYIREEGLLTKLKRYAFSQCYYLTEVTLKGVLSTNDEISRDCVSSTWNLPNCTEIGFDFLGNTSSNQTITVNAPKCTVLGSNASDNGVFCKWWGNMKFHITVNSALQTANSGAPDGDLVGLNSGSTVTYVS